MSHGGMADWIVESSPLKALYNRWLHTVEKFVLKRF